MTPPRCPTCHAFVAASDLHCNLCGGAPRITDADADVEVASSLVAWLNSWQPSHYEGQRVASTDVGEALLRSLDAARVRLRDRLAAELGVDPRGLYWEDDS